MTKNFKYTDNATGRQTEAAVYTASEFVNSHAPNAPVLTGSDGYINSNLIPPVTQAKASSLVVSRKATGNILRGEVVRPITGNHVAIADPNDTLIKANSIGVALGNALDGEDIEVLLIGTIIDPAFGIFTINSILFLDDLGGITDVRPTAPSKKYLVIIGKYLGANEILVNVQTPTSLGA